MPTAHRDVAADLSLDRDSSCCRRGGKERTAQDFARLLAGAGLKLERVIPIENSFLAVLEASRAN
jgi:hypothetical protein